MTGLIVPFPVEDPTKNQAKAQQLWPGFFMD
jgi:hypothetical protein